MYVIYVNIYHQYTPNVSIYTSTMDPMGDIASPLSGDHPQHLKLHKESAVDLRKPLMASPSELTQTKTKQTWR
jgi:hypothetical protein